MVSVFPFPLLSIRFSFLPGTTHPKILPFTPPRSNLPTYSIAAVPILRQNPKALSFPPPPPPLPPPFFFLYPQPTEDKQSILKSLIILITYRVFPRLRTKTTDYLEEEVGQNSFHGVESADIQGIDGGCRLQAREGPRWSVPWRGALLRPRELRKHLLLQQRLAGPVESLAFFFILPCSLKT